jgi:hypothetical protein
MSMEIPPVPDALMADIQGMLLQHEGTLAPHAEGDTCPLAVESPMTTACEFYQTLDGGVVSVCGDCGGCAEHCECWEREPEIDDEYGHVDIGGEG